MLILRSEQLYVGLYREGEYKSPHGSFHSFLYSHSAINTAFIVYNLYHCICTAVKQQNGEHFKCYISCLLANS